MVAKNIAKVSKNGTSTLRKASLSWRKDLVEINNNNSLRLQIQLLLWLPKRTNMHFRTSRWCRAVSRGNWKISSRCYHDRQAYDQEWCRCRRWRCHRDGTLQNSSRLFSHYCRKGAALDQRDRSRPRDHSEVKFLAQFSTKLCPVKVNVPMTGHSRMLYQYRDIHTKSYFRLSFAHGLSRNRDVSRHWYVYLTSIILFYFPLFQYPILDNFATTPASMQPTFSTNCDRSIIKENVGTELISCPKISPTTWRLVFGSQQS